MWLCLVTSGLFWLSGKLLITRKLESKIVLLIWSAFFYTVLCSLTCAQKSAAAIYDIVAAEWDTSTYVHPPLLIASC